MSQSWIGSLELQSRSVYPSAAGRLQRAATDMPKHFVAVRFVNIPSSSRPGFCLSSRCLMRCTASCQEEATTQLRDAIDVIPNVHKHARAPIPSCLFSFLEAFSNTFHYRYLSITSKRPFILLPVCRAEHKVVDKFPLQAFYGRATMVKGTESETIALLTPWKAGRFELAHRLVLHAVPAL